MKHKLSACILISTLAYTVHGTQHTIPVPCTQCNTSPWYTAHNTSTWYTINTQYNTGPWYTTHNTVLVHGTILVHDIEHQ